MRRPAAHQQPGSVELWRLADRSMKQRAERAEALEADRETDFGHAQLAGGQQRLGLLDPPVYQILMRRLIERLLEQTDEVVAREAGLAGDALQVERLVVAGV